MANYVYKCDLCEYTLEISHSMMDPPLVTCPECSQDALKRLLFPPSIHMEPSTVGSLAEKNANTLSRDAKNDIIKRRGGTPIPDPSDKPFYKVGQNYTSQQIARFTPEQKKKYIETGRI